MPIHVCFFFKMYTSENSSSVHNMEVIITQPQYGSLIFYNYHLVWHFVRSMKGWKQWLHKTSLVHTLLCSTVNMKNVSHLELRISINPSLQKKPNLIYMQKLICDYLGAGYGNATGSILIGNQLIILLFTCRSAIVSILQVQKCK